jgi:hypothetical protein
MHRRKSGCGEQHETKVCHDGLGPRMILDNKAWQQGLAINE